MLKILIILLLGVTKLFAQTGAADEGLAAQVAVSRGEWALWRNPSGLTRVDAPVVSLGIKHLAPINLLNKSALLAMNTRAGCLAAGMSSFGDELYNEQTLSLGFAHNIGITNIGIRTDILQLRIDGLGLRRTFGVTIGATTSIGSRVVLGAVARNINLPQWTDGPPLPVVLNAAILFAPSENFLLITEVEKNTDFDPTIKGAFEYSLRKKFFVRTGFNLIPVAAFGGFGFRVWRFGFDYALRWGYHTAYSQQFSVSLKSFKKRSSK